MIKVEFTIKDIDYGDLSYQLLPVLLNKMSKKEKASRIIRILSGMQNVPGTVAKAAFAVLPQETKDELVAKIIHGYKDEIIASVNAMIKDKSLKMSIVDVEAKKL